MPCHHPVSAYYSKHVNKDTNKRSLVFNQNQANDDQLVRVPCGQCTACRLEKSRQWAVRCVHEAQLYENNSFITLTYDDQNIPKTKDQIYWSEDIPLCGNLKTLNLTHFQSFMKRLRKHQDDTFLDQDYDEHFLFNRDHSKNIRFFHAGEYGEQTDRPHYHAIFFGVGLRDQNLVNDIWGKGFVDFGTVTFESCRYTANYLDKKYYGQLAEDYYTRHGREVPFQVVSQGIGLRFAEANKDSIAEDLFISMQGDKHSIPRFYRKKLALPSSSFRSLALANQEKTEIACLEETKDVSTSALHEYKHERARMREANLGARTRIQRARRSL